MEAIQVAEIEGILKTVGYWVDAFKGRKGPMKWGAILKVRTLGLILLVGNQTLWEKWQDQATESDDFFCPNCSLLSSLIYFFQDRSQIFANSIDYE